MHRNYFVRLLYKIIKQVRPIMTSSFGNVLYTGPMGTALIPKVFSNMLTCVHLVAAAEVMMVGKLSLN